VPVPSQNTAFYTIPAGDNSYLESVLLGVYNNGLNAVVSFAAGGTYKLLREHIVVTQLVLTGASATGGAVVLTPFDTNTRHFYVGDAGSKLTLVSLTVASGYLTNSQSNPGMGGAVYLGADTIGRFVNVTFYNNTLLSSSNTRDPLAWGGAIYATQVLSLTLLYCQFIQNRALETVTDGSVYGGGLMVYHPNSLVMSYCTFRGNLAQLTGEPDSAEAGGGAVALFLSASSASSVTLRSCSFLRNQAIIQTTGSTGFNSQGGAVWVRDRDTSGTIITFYRCTFSSNVASISLASNSAETYSYGGAVYAESIRVRVNSSVFTNNTAIISTTSSPSNENIAKASGGAACVTGCSVRVTGRSRFVGNKAVSFREARGGAVAVLDGNQAYASFVSGAVFQANLALASAAGSVYAQTSLTQSAGGGTLAAYGGAVHDTCFTALFVNSSFTSNGAIVRGVGPADTDSGTGQGGALHITGHGLTFVRCNVTSNYVRGKEGSTGILVEVMGGGISADCSSCILTLNRTTLTNNSAVHWGSHGRAKGGGAYIRAGDLYAYGGTTFRRNVATSASDRLGGAVCGDDSDGLTSVIGLYDAVVVPYSGDDTTTAYNSVYNTAQTNVLQPTQVRQKDERGMSLRQADSCEP
jgi:predicted outer membrane repeat protein